MKLTNENRWLYKIKDLWFNYKQAAIYTVWYPIFDRFRWLVGVLPEYGNYFLRLQMVRQTIRARSRKLKTGWTVEDTTND